MNNEKPSAEFDHASERKGQNEIKANEGQYVWNGAVYEWYQTPKREMKPKFERRIVDVVMTCLIIILSILAVSAFLWDGLRIGYTIVYDVSLIAATVFLAQRGEKIKFSEWATAILSLVCSWTFAVTSSYSVRAFSLILTAVGVVLIELNGGIV